LVGHLEGSPFAVNISSYEDLGRERFAMLFESYFQMGTLKRVDFTSRNHPKTGRKITSAFLHFENLNDTAFTRGVCERIKKWGKTILYGVPYPAYLQEEQQVEPWHENALNTFWFWSSENQPRHLILRENLSPIPEAVSCELNVHQLVAMNAVLEHKLAEKDARIRELEALIQQQPNPVLLSTPTRAGFLEPPPLPPKLKREGSALYCFPPMDLDAQAADLPPLQGEAVLHYDGKPVSLAKSLFSDN